MLKQLLCQQKLPRPQLPTGKLLQMPFVLIISASKFILSTSLPIGHHKLLPPPTMTSNLPHLLSLLLSKIGLSWSLPPFHILLSLFLEHQHFASPHSQIFSIFDSSLALPPNVPHWKLPGFAPQTLLYSHSQVDLTKPWVFKYHLQPMVQAFLYSCLLTSIWMFHTSPKQNLIWFPNDSSDRFPHLVNGPPLCCSGEKAVSSLTPLFPSYHLSHNCQSWLLDKWVIFWICLLPITANAVSNSPAKAASSEPLPPFFSPIRSSPANSQGNLQR